MDGRSDGRLLAAVLAPAKVRRIICVDDAYGKPVEPGVEAVVGWIDAEIAGGRKDRLDAFAPDLGHPLFDGDGWDQVVRGWWEEADGDARAAAVRRVAELLGCALVPDRRGTDTLRQLVEESGSLTLIELTPDEWLARRDALLHEATKDERSLILFDHDLTAAEMSPTAGADLMRQAIDTYGHVTDEDDRCAYFGLLSDFFSEADEEMRWRDTATQHRVALDAFLPIAKARLTEPAAFAHGVQLALINASHERLNAAVGRIAADSAAEARKAMQEFTVWDFDQFLRSSEYEGVWEIETLFRVQSIFELRERRTRAWTERAAFAKEIAIIRAVREVETPIDSATSPRVREVARAELYQGSEINDVHLPLELGDLFQTDKGKFVLLVQPCELILRPRDAQRRATWAVLVPIKEATEREGVNEVQRPACPHFADTDDGTTWCAHFGKASEVPLVILDLVVFCSDGIAAIRPSDPCPSELFVPWPKRYDALRAQFSEIEDRIKLIQECLPKGGATGTAVQKVMRDLLARFAPSKGILAPTYANGEFAFSIRRVGRMIGGQAVELLDKYHAYRRRPASEHDLARVAPPKRRNPAAASVGAVSGHAPPAA